MLLVGIIYILFSSIASKPIGKGSQPYKKSCIASNYRQFFTNIKNHAINTSFVSLESPGLIISISSERCL